MTVWEFLLSLRPMIPYSTEKPCTLASNTELRRWCNSGAVLINGERTKSWDQEMQFPCTQLVFFPNAKRRTTIY